MAEKAGGESPYEVKVAVRVKHPEDKSTVTTRYWSVKGTAPPGSTVYYMEVMKGQGDLNGPETVRWMYPITTVAAADGTFVIEPLVNGTGLGDIRYLLN